MNISKIPQKKIVEGIKGRYFHTESNTIGFVDIEKGVWAGRSGRGRGRGSQVTEGRLEMTIDGVTQILEPGSIYFIPSNVIHSAIALTDCKVTDIFSPVREDYK